MTCGPLGIELLDGERNPVGKRGAPEAKGKRDKAMGDRKQVPGLLEGFELHSGDSLENSHLRKFIFCVQHNMGKEKGRRLQPGSETKLFQLCRN